MEKRIEVVDPSALKNKNNWLSIAILAFLFFIFGFTTWINAILIPFFKISCELTNFESLLVAFAFYIAYFVMSIPSSILLKAVGFKKGMMIGFWFMAIGCFIFVPAALTRTFGVFLMGLFTIGIGLAILQTAANPYITIIGPRESAAQRMSIMGICNKGAGILAPILLTAVILKATDSALFSQLATMTEVDKNVALDELIRRVIPPYACLGTFLLAFGLMIRYSPLPEINTEHESEEVATANQGKTSILQFPHLILGAVAMFLHVGTQVIGINTIINYAKSLDIGILEAKVFPAYTLAMTMIGYLCGVIFIPKYLKQVNALRICTSLGVIFTLMFFMVHGNVTFLGHNADLSIWFIVLLGFANSLIYAGIWPLALEGLGRFTKLGSSILIMGLCGSAILPLIYGKFADMYDVRTGYWVLLPGYLYLVYYAFYGHLVRNWSFVKTKRAQAEPTVINPIIDK
jgi:MFS transporter, FHS family, L-fucose permease